MQPMASVSGVGGGLRVCKLTPKSFDLVKIRAKSVEIWTKYVKAFVKTLDVH